MPLPVPHKGEPRAEFMNRCMGDETMKRDFADDKQRLAVCFKQEKQRDRKQANMAIQATVEFDIEAEESCPSKS